MKMVLTFILIVLIINLFFFIKTKDKETYKKIKPYIYPKEKSIPVIFCLVLWFREYYIFGMLIYDSLILYTFVTALIYLINFKQTNLNLFFLINVVSFFYFFFLKINYSVLYFLTTLLLLILDFREQKKSKTNNKTISLCCTFILIAFVIYKIIFGYSYYY